MFFKTQGGINILKTTEVITKSYSALECWLGLYSSTPRARGNMETHPEVDRDTKWERKASDRQGERWGDEGGKELQTSLS